MTDATRKDLERFIKELEALDVDDPPSGNFQGKTLDSLEAPHPADKMATVTVSIPKTALFTAEAKLALAGAVVICDRWYVMASDSKVRLSFVVGNIWKDGGNTNAE